MIREILNGAQRVLVLEEQGSAVGFPCPRRFGHGYVIGPIVAANLAQAQLLVSQLLSGLYRQFVRIGSACAAGLAPWLNIEAMVQVDTPVRLHKGAPCQGDSGAVKTFGLMSQAMS